MTLRRPKLYIGAAILIVIIIIGIIVIATRQNNADLPAKALPKSEQIIRSVSAHYAVPPEEQPTVAEIRDHDKLKDQAFYTKAKNGDYVLVYKKARLAIIYRQSIDRLIEVSPVASPINEP